MREKVNERKKEANSIVFRGNSLYTFDNREMSKLSDTMGEMIGYGNAAS